MCHLYTYYLQWNYCHYSLSLSIIMTRKEISDNEKYNGNLHYLTMILLRECGKGNLTQDFRCELQVSTNQLATCRNSMKIHRKTQPAFMVIQNFTQRKKLKELN